MAMAKGAFRLNTFMLGQNFKSDYSFGKASTTFVKGNTTVQRKVVMGRTIIYIYKGNQLLNSFDISGGPQKAEVVAKFKEFITQLA